jgi:hypothetical protein
MSELLSTHKHLVRKKPKTRFWIYLKDSGQNVPVIHTSDIMTRTSKEGNVLYTKTTPSKARDLRALKRLGERGKV